MRSSGAKSPARVRVRYVVLWSAFMALLVLGLVLYFRYPTSVAPLLDAMLER